MTASNPEAVTRAIAVLESARQRKSMYFERLDPGLVEHWISGLRIGLEIAGFPFQPELRKAPLERRGMELAAMWETEQLESRGLSGEKIIDDLLAIEIEMLQQLTHSAAGNSWFITGLVELVLATGFYGILLFILLIAWAVGAPNAPSANEGAGIAIAFAFHLVPTILWLWFRKQLTRFSAWVRWGCAIVSWMIIPLSVAVMINEFGV